MNIFLLFMYLLIYIPIFAIFISMPYLTRKDELFGVKIPESESKSLEAVTLKKAYVKTVSIVIFLILVLFICVDLYFKINPPFLATYGMFIVLAVYFSIYLVFHNKSKKIKAVKNWGINVVNKVTITTNYREKLKLPSPLWFILYIGIIAVTIYLGFAYYSVAPDKIPIKYGLDGTVTKWAEKSPKLMLFAPVTQVFITVLMSFVYWIIKKAKQQINPQNPEESIIRDRVFRYRWSMFTVVMGLVLLLLFGFMQLTFVGIITNYSLIMILSMTIPFLIIIYAIVLSFTTGQGGSRVRIGKSKEGTSIDRNDDKYWKLGVFYYNTDDPAIFVQKRFGIGWTNNFARPLTWILLIALFLVIGFFAIFSHYLTS